MNTTHRILTATLGLQLLLGLATWNMGAGAPEAGTRPLLAVDLGAITAFTVEARAPAGDKPPHQVRLVRQGGNWTLADAGDYPADKAKVEDVLGKLLELRVGEPIAETKVSHEALRVGERDFDKRVRLEAGGKSYELVLGNGKGSSSNLRLGDSDQVFWAKGITPWAIADDGSAYLDTQYVACEDPTKVALANKHGAIVLEKGADGGWKLVSFPGTVDKAKADALVAALSKVRLAEPVGREVKPEYGLGDGAKVELTDKDGKATKYTIGALVDDKYYVLAEGRDHVVQVGKWGLDKAVDQKAEDLLAAPAKPGA